MIRMTAAEFQKRYGRKVPNKYKNEKCSWGDKDFPSKREMNRYIELFYMAQAGEISDLQTQVKYVLIPAQRENGKVVEREVAYIADFVYRDQNENVVVEDAKGFRTREYILKRKMLLDKFGIRIKEV